MHISWKAVLRAMQMHPRALALADQLQEAFCGKMSCDKNPVIWHHSLYSSVVLATSAAQDSDNSGNAFVQFKACAALAPCLKGHAIDILSVQSYSTVHIAWHAKADFASMVFLVW